MTPENLICIAAGFALGIAGIFLVEIVRERIRQRRLRHIPRGTVLFRP
jgi:hypothetical protein